MKWSWSVVAEPEQFWGCGVPAPSKLGAGSKGVVFAGTELVLEGLLTLPVQHFTFSLRLPASIPFILMPLP